ncbi:MAG: fumarylacetoacetate hydrolase family protein [Actinomycetes bacterium]
MKIGTISTQSNPYSLTFEDESGRFQLSQFPTLAEFLATSLSELRESINSAERIAIGTQAWGAPIAAGTEIWGAGVTYLRSRDARIDESSTPDVYAKVYDAERPELFLKGTASRTVGTLGSIGIRFDATSSIPEPELALVINSHGECVGLTICNDVTARSIEGENPLYLSQAKIYRGSTALGPYITPIWEIEDHSKIQIDARIERGKENIWEASTSFGQLRRTFDELIGFLFRCQDFPEGVILSTGTGIIPPDHVHLQQGDVVTMSATHLGTLENRVQLMK